MIPQLRVGRNLQYAVSDISEAYINWHLDCVCHLKRKENGVWISNWVEEFPGSSPLQDQIDKFWAHGTGDSENDAPKLFSGIYIFFKTCKMIVLEKGTWSMAQVWENLEIFQFEAIEAPLAGKVAYICVCVCMFSTSVFANCQFELGS